MRIDLGAKGVMEDNDIEEEVSKCYEGLLYAVFGGKPQRITNVLHGRGASLSVPVKAGLHLDMSNGKGKEIRYGGCCE